MVRFSGVLYFQTNNAAALHMSLANRRRVREATNGAELTCNDRETRCVKKIRIDLAIGSMVLVYMPTLGVY